MYGRVAALVLADVDVTSGKQEFRCGLLVVVGNGFHQRGVPPLVLHVHVRPRAQQDVNEPRGTVSCCKSTYLITFMYYEI